MKMEIHGDVLDFACGTGVLGASIAANHADCRVTLLDTNALAIKASEETLTANKLKGTLLASNGLSELNKSFDLIVSNPPIHAGIKTDNRLSIGLLDSVREHIKPKGLFMMVANVHLPYEKWLLQKFKRTIQVLANDSYKVILAKT